MASPEGHSRPGGDHRVRAGTRSRSRGASEAGRWGEGRDPVFPICPGLRGFLL